MASTNNPAVEKREIKESAAAVNKLADVRQTVGTSPETTGSANSPVAKSSDVTPPETQGRAVAAQKKTKGNTRTGGKTSRKAVDATVSAGKDAVEPVVKAGAKVARKGVEQVAAASHEQVAAANAGKDAYGSYEDIIAFGKGNFDAIIAANTSFVKGMQAINAEFFAIAQSALEKNAAATQQMMACTTVDEVVSLQNDLLQSSYEAAIEKGRKMSDLGTRVAEESAAPLNERLTVAVGKLIKPLAA